MPYWQAGGAIVGALISSGSAKSGSGKAARGSQKELDLIRDMMLLSRSDTQHTRQMGATALNAMGRMTGLIPGMGTTYTEDGYPVETGSPEALALNPPVSDGFEVPTDAPMTFPDAPPIAGGGRASAWQDRQRHRALGGMIGREVNYNVHELGPENIYSGGSYTRGKGPVTIDGRTGYVEPHTANRAIVENRGLGGFLGKIVNFGNKFDPVLNKAVKSGFGKELAGEALGQPGALSGKPSGIVGGNSGFSTETDIDTTQGQDYNWTAEPGYKFRFDEGQKSLDRSASARGGLLSGGFAKKMVRYGQGFASNEFSNVFNRLASIGGMGQTANQNASNVALQGGFGMGAAAGAKGINSAYGSIGAGNAVGTAINDIDWASLFNRP